MASAIRKKQRSDSEGGEAPLWTGAEKAWIGADNTERHTLDNRLHRRDGPLSGLPRSKKTNLWGRGSRWTARAGISLWVVQDGAHR